MKQPGPRLYGEELGRVLGVSSPPSLLLRPDTSSLFAVTAIQFDGDSSIVSGPVRAEKGFTICVHLKKPDASGWGSWINGQFKKVKSWEEGGVGIYDLESNPRVLRNSPYQSIHFNIPRSTLDVFTDDAELRRVTSLRNQEGMRDEVLFHLAQIMLPSLMGQYVLPDLFADYFIQLLCSRLVTAYGTLALTSQPARGGLTPWQMRRAMELLDQHLSGDLRLGRLANECGLSTGYFCRCFRTAFGTSVHKFLIQKRIARAKELLLQSQQSLAEISVATGFSDQAALSRTFNAIVGISPARWRTKNRVKNCISISSSALHSDGPSDQTNFVYRRSGDGQVDSEKAQISLLKLAHER